jgi:diaminopimelate epimerase
MTAFLKMHGLGNDFAVFDARNGTIGLDEATARAIADRRFGIGCDQVIVIGRGSHDADATMRILNADGGEVEACGNATRCVAQLLMEERDVASVKIDTPGGLLVCRDAGNGLVTVDMGKPEFDWKKIPLSREVDTNSFVLDVLPRDASAFAKAAADKPQRASSLRSWRGEVTASALATGNPHCVFFVDDAENEAVEVIGPLVEHHPLFPARVNVEFVTVRSPSQLRMRVWERGVGITKACGTGACAAAVAAMRRGLAERKADVVLDGGTLTIEWSADDHMLMTGPATLAYRGDVDLAALSA